MLHHSMKESNQVNSMGKRFSKRQTIFSYNFLYFMLEINMYLNIIPYSPDQNKSYKLSRFLTETCGWDVIC